MFAMRPSVPSIPPYLKYFGVRRRYLQESVKYNKHCYLDVWSTDPNWQNNPTLVFIPGGGWSIGSRLTFQGHALMHRMIKKGWTCVSIDYRTTPRSWPTPLDDVQDAILWARDHTTGFVALAGASAGGHMATLAGLQGYGDAVVSLYGSYDWEFRGTLWRRVFMRFLENWVVGKGQSKNPDLYHESSPMAQVHRLAPPMCILHGTRDHLISINEARIFKNKLAKVSRSPVRYLEVPADHGFDLYNTAQSRLALRVAEKFLSDMYHLKTSVEQPALFSME